MGQWMGLSWVNGLTDQMWDLQRTNRNGKRPEVLVYYKIQNIKILFKDDFHILNLHFITINYARKGQ